MDLLGASKTISEIVYNRVVEKGALEKIEIRRTVKEKRLEKLYI